MQYVEESIKNLHKERYKSNNKTLLRANKLPISEIICISGYFSPLCILYFME